MAAVGQATFRVLRLLHNEYRRDSTRTETFYSHSFSLSEFASRAGKQEQPSLSKSPVVGADYSSPNAVCISGCYGRDILA